MQDMQDDERDPPENPEPARLERLEVPEDIPTERASRLQWAMIVVGPIGLAVAIFASLWSSSRQIERSVNVQVEQTWAPGEQLAMRSQIVGADLKPLKPDAEVSIAVARPDGSDRRELGGLERVGPGLAQARFEVPALAPGEAELIVQFAPGPDSWIEPFEERVPITILAERVASSGRQVVSGHILQWADDTDPQPEGVRIDVRPSERLLAGFDNQVFVRVTDPAGKPWRPSVATVPANIQVLLISGEFGGLIGKSEDPPILYAGPVDELGLARFSGRLSSDVVRFEVRLIAEADVASKPTYLTGPKRRLRFVSHAGTVKVYASTDFAHPGDTVELAVEAISARKPVFVDTHGPSGAWLDTFTLTAPQVHEWTIPDETEVGGILQFEAYQTTLRPEDSSALARVQLVAAEVTPAKSIAALIEGQRAQLSLPRVDAEFEVGRERAYLSAVEAKVGSLDPAAVERARAFLLGSLEAVVYGPPQAINTRAREEADLIAFKQRWTARIRWGLICGGLLFIVLMTALIGRNQRTFERASNLALGLVAGAPPGERDEEMFADQSLSIVRSRQQLLIRGSLMIGLMILTLVLTLAMLESLVWEY